MSKMQDVQSLLIYIEQLSMVAHIVTIVAI